MKLFLIILSSLVLFFQGPGSVGKTNETFELKKESGRLEEKVKRAAENQFPKDSDLFRPPTEAQQKVWRRVVEQVSNRALKEALNVLRENALSFEIVLFTDHTTGREYVLLEEKKPLRLGWGFYAFDLETKSPLMIEVPHSIADARTESEGVDAFLETRAAAFLMAGAHRRSNKKETDCSQPDSGDQSNDETTYPESDVAHSVLTVFQTTHETWVTLKPKTVAVQLHGMANRPICPSVFMSSGTKTVTSNTTKLFDCLKKQNVEVGVWEGNAGGCRLGATTNVQGRYSNNERRDPCHTPAQTAPEPGYFIHLEQKPSVRRDKESWKPVIDALKCAFP